MVEEPLVAVVRTMKSPTGSWLCTITLSVVLTELPSSSVTVNCTVFNPGESHAGIGLALLEVV